MLSLLWTFLSVYLLALGAGLGIYLWLIPGAFRAPPLAPLLAPALGLLFIAILSAELIALNTDATLAGPLSLALSGVLTLAFAWRWRSDWSSGSLFLKNIVTGESRAWIAFVLLAGVLLSPALQAGGAVMPYRAGIDLTGYVETAQYLLQGGTLRAAAQTMGSELGKEPFDERATSHALSFNAYVDTEYLNKALRWGVPSVVATMARMVGAKHVLEVFLFVLIFPFLALVAISYSSFRAFFAFSSGRALVYSLALALNANLLNVFYEGQCAQSFTAPFFALLLFLLFRIRQDSDSDKQRQRWFIAFLVAGLFACYSELIFLSSILMVAMVGLDFVLNRRFRGRVLSLVGSGVLLGALIVFPLTIRWAHYIIAQLRFLHGGGGGFWQPQWASPAEMVGLGNIYALPGYHYEYIGRTPMGLFITVVLSAAIGGLVFALFRARRDLDWAFWLAPPFFVAAILVKTRFIDGGHNYQYMKAYTNLAVPLFSIVALALENAVGGAGPLVRVLRLAQPLLLTLVLASGLGFILQFNRESTFLSNDEIAHYTVLNEKLGLDHWTMFVNSDHIATGGPLDEYLLATTIPMHWLAEGGHFKNLAPHLEDRVLVLLNQRDLECPKCVLAEHAGNILFADNRFIFLDTGKRLRDGLDSAHAGTASIAPFVSGVSDVVITGWPTDIYWASWTRRFENIQNVFGR